MQPSASKRISAPSLGVPRAVSRKQAIPRRPAPRRSAAALRELSNQRLRRRLVEIGGKASAIDHHAQGAPIRKLGDQVALAQARGIAADPTRGGGDQALAD